MILSEVRIHNFRNIASTSLILNPNFNCITGPNGSGKTSLLEALYMLSCAHSFRSREVTQLFLMVKTNLMFLPMLMTKALLVFRNL